MIIYLIISLICILTTYSYQKIKYALEISFVILTVFFAIRYDFGTDYPQYLLHFELANQGNVTDALDSERFEDGWVLLCRVFQPIGFFGMVIFVTIFENIVLYRMIKKYVSKQWYWLALFCYLFTTSLSLTGLSMMRQYLAMCVCMIAFDLAIRKKVIISALLVLLAGQFHTSAFVCIPICFIGHLKKHKLSNFSSIALIIVLFIINFAAISFFGGYLTNFIRDSVFDVYEGRLGENYEGIVGISTFFNYYLFAVILLMQGSQDKSNSLFVLIFLLFFVIDAFKPIAPLISRVGLYFYILFPICMTNAIIKMNKQWMQLTIVFLILFRVYGYFSFVLSPGWGNSFLVYRTIFSVDYWM